MCWTCEKSHSGAADRSVAGDCSSRGVNETAAAGVELKQWPLPGQSEGISRRQFAEWERADCWRWWTNRAATSKDTGREHTDKVRLSDIFLTWNTLDVDNKETCYHVEKHLCRFKQKYLWEDKKVLIKTKVILYLSFIHWFACSRSKAVVNAWFLMGYSMKVSGCKMLTRNTWEFALFFNQF